MCVSLWCVFNTLCLDVNNRMKEAESAAKLVNLCNELEEGEELMAPHRRYIYECEAYGKSPKMKSQEFRIVVFNDLLVLITHKRKLLGKKKDKIKHRFWLSEVIKENSLCMYI